MASQIHRMTADEHGSDICSAFLATESMTLNLWGDFPPHHARRSAIMTTTPLNTNAALKAFTARRDKALVAHEAESEALVERAMFLFDNEANEKSVAFEAEVNWMLKGSQLLAGASFTNPDRPFVLAQLLFAAGASKPSFGDVLTRRGKGLGFGKEQCLFIHCDREAFFDLMVAKTIPPEMPTNEALGDGEKMKLHTAAINAARKEVSAFMRAIRHVECFASWKRWVPRGYSEKTGREYEAFRSSDWSREANGIYGALQQGTELPTVAFNQQAKADADTANARGPWYSKLTLADDGTRSDEWRYNEATGLYEAVATITPPDTHEADVQRAHNRAARKAALPQFRDSDELIDRILDAADA
jgi:hypothetical protein